MNCPKTMHNLPFSNLPTILSKMGLPNKQVVCYLGSIGKDKGVLETARSMSYWPKDSVFVLIGSSSQETKQEILANAGAARASKRVLFLGFKPHAEALALLAGSDIGLSLIQPSSRNWLFSAGAINKRFEYMAVGLPQITNDGPGVAELIEKRGCGLCVNPNSYEEIGHAIRRLLESPAERRKMSESARAWHLKEFNYESQFADVADWIEDACQM
jgi:glycosyltransferase involved in cell wall biosynthesis